MSTVKRKLTFSAWMDDEQRPFERIEAAEAIEDLEGNDQILEHGDALTAVEVMTTGGPAAPTHLRLLALRDYENRPAAWEPGQMAAPVRIGENQYIADITHVVLWDDKIVAHDVYGDAPGLGRLSAYLRSKADQHVVFRALYEPDTAERLKDLRGLRSVEFSIHTPNKRENAVAAGMFADLINQNAFKKVPSVHVSIGMGRSGRRDTVLDEGISDEALEAAEKAEQFFDSLYIAGPSKTETTQRGQPKTVRINLLSQRVQIEQDIERSADGGNLPERQAIYRALHQARKALEGRDALVRALDARLTLEKAP